jgi:pimeloyl-ACP methyl ester carboxylesterase
MTPAPEELLLDTPYGRLAALRLGTAGGTPVLALHGWLDNAASFVPLAAHLEGVDLVALDLPGHGRSDHLPSSAEYSLPGTVHTVLDAADALGWERFAVLGHSMGAAIGSILAAAAPDRVTRFVAIEALGALADAEEHTALRLREAVVARRALRGKALRVFPDADTAVRARMQAGVTGASGLDEPLARLLVERGLRPVVAGEGNNNHSGGLVWSTDQRLTISTAMRMTEGQVRDLLAHIQCPVRVVYAEPAQSYFPEPLRSERAALLPPSALVRMAGGHHLHMERPAAVAAAIGGFLHGDDGR